MPVLRPTANSPHYDPSQPYDPPMTSTATAIRFGTIAKANINAISSAPGHDTSGISSSSSLHPSGSLSATTSSRPKSVVSFSQDAIDKAKEREEEAKAKAKLEMKERAKARLVPQTPRSPGPHTPKTAEIMREVDGTLQVLRENMGRLSARGESIEALEARTEGLARSAQAFRRTSKNVRREMQWKELKMRLIIGFVILVVVGLTIFSIVQAVRDAQYRERMLNPTIEVAVVTTQPAHPAPTEAPAAGVAVGNATATATADGPSPTSTNITGEKVAPAAFVDQQQQLGKVAAVTEAEEVPPAADGEPGSEPGSESTLAEKPTEGEGEETGETTAAEAVLHGRNWYWYEFEELD